MAQIIDLFKQETRNLESNSIYGKDGIRIASKGAVNPRRLAALLASSPTIAGDMIASQISGLVGGDANRPDDTIYKNKKFFSKPISLLNGGGPAPVREGTDYFVKTNSSPEVLGKLPKLVSDPIGTATSIAADALKNPAGAIQGVKNFVNAIKNRKAEPNIYGTKFMQDDAGKTLSTTKKFSDWTPSYTIPEGENDYKRTGTTSREINTKWDYINNIILNQGVSENEEAESLIKQQIKNNKVTHVKIKIYGKPRTIYLPGTITGLSDDFSPEWSNFRYVGSPFMQYRYVGVERSIKFNLKLYYVDEASKLVMLRSINNLKKLVFPDENLSVITYGDNKKNQPLAFSPTLIQMSISGLYENLFGFVEELGFSIDDNVSWATTDIDMDGNKTAPYPSVIDVSFGMKVIPNATYEENANKEWSYNIDFDGTTPINTYAPAYTGKKLQAPAPTFSVPFNNPAKGILQKSIPAPKFAVKF